MMEDLKEQFILQNDLNNLKEILIHSKNNINSRINIIVPESRYIKILNDYWSLNGIFVDGAINEYLKYDFVILTKLDSNENVYKITIKREYKEPYGRCKNCNCDVRVKSKTGRFINPDTGICYYNEMIEKNYTTKI